MPTALFNPDNIREDIDLEAKLAGGRDGKGAMPKSMFETYSAFANTAGGVIFLGLREREDHSFEVKGIERADQVIDDIWNQLNNPQKVSCNLLDTASIQKLQLANGRWIIEISIPRATRKQCPVFIKGNPLTGTFKRQATGDFHCTEDEIRRMFAEQSEDTRDARILEGFTLKDIDGTSLTKYRNRFADLNLNHPFSDSSDQDFLGFLGGWKVDRATGLEGLTLAGLLMFGKERAINDALPNYFVDYRELPIEGTVTEWDDRLVPDGTWSGNVYDFYMMTILRLTRDLKVPFRLVGDTRDNDTPVHKGIREALVNALVHADYAARTAVLIMKAPGLFSFRNPGRMRIPVEDALKGGSSDCRNRNMQKMFRLINLGEQAGSGIPRMMKNWESQHYRPPELTEHIDSEFTLMKLRTVSLLPDETLQEMAELFGSNFECLQKDERMALATAHIEGYVTNNRLQQISQQHPSDITALLTSLVSRGMLLKDGRGPATTYRVRGLASVDLANVGKSESSSRDIDSSSEGKELRSEGKAESSCVIDSSSTHIDSSSAHIETSSAHMKNPQLLEIVRDIRGCSRVKPDRIREAILDLCRNRFLTLAQIGELMDRAPNGIRFRFIKPMLNDGLLERRFPNQPNHERQAYRTKGSNDE